MQMNSENRLKVRFVERVAVVVTCLLLISTGAFAAPGGSYLLGDTSRNTLKLIAGHHNAKAESSSLVATDGSRPSWTDVAQAIGSVGGVLVAIVGFVFVIRQLRQVENAMKKDAVEALYARAFDIQSIILNDPALREYFYDNKTQPADSVMRAKLETVSEIVFDFYELIVDEKEFMSPGLYTSWEHYLKDLYSRSPTLRSHLDVNSKWYSDAVLGFFEK